MSEGVRRVVFAALAACGLLFVLSGSAQAQSVVPAGDETIPAASLKLDYDAAVRSIGTTTAVRAGNASFLRQGGAANEDSGIGVGVLGMLTWPNFDPELDEPIDVDGRSGWGIGGWVGGNRNGRIGFVGEFIYLVRNGRASDPENIEGPVDVKFKVFELPAVFHINFGSRSRNSVGGFVVVGPVFSFNLGQEVDGQSLDDDEKFKGAEIGIIAGAGIEFFRIGIEGRGNWGLNSISTEGDLEKVKTFTFELVGKFAFN
jgi:hypothetical protein